MQDISIRELMDLATTKVSNSESRIQRVYEWHFEREMIICKWVLGLAVSLGLSFLVALFRTESTVGFWQTVVWGASIISTAIYGLFRLRRVRAIHKQFIASLRLHAELREIGPFLRKYRRRKV